MTTELQKQKNKEALSKEIGAVLVFPVTALFALVAWNVGVDGVVAAAGGNVDTINYLTAVGGSLAAGFLRYFFVPGARGE